MGSGSSKISKPPPPVFVRRGWSSEIETKHAAGPYTFLDWAGFKEQYEPAKKKKEKKQKKAKEAPPVK